MPTRPNAKERALIRAAFQFAQSKIEDPDLDGHCIEASVWMHQYLRQRGMAAELVRYELPTGEGGHWTIRTPVGEFDPTIGHWKLRAANEVQRPKFARPGMLYSVTATSPHKTWAETEAIERYAYETVTCRLGRGCGGLAAFVREAD